MVPKPGEGWHICIDFTDLNKVIPKKPYPLPRIDPLVDSVAGHELLLSLDAFKGYYQILMVKEDMPQPSFVINVRIYCYTRMPFELRNAGANF